MPEWLVVVVGDGASEVVCAAAVVASEAVVAVAAFEAKGVDTFYPRPR